MRYFQCQCAPPDSIVTIKAAENPKIAINPIQSILRRDTPKIMVCIIGTAPATIRAFKSLVN